MAIVKVSEAAAKKAASDKVATAKKAAATVKATAAKTAEKLTIITKAAARRSTAEVKAPVVKTSEKTTIKSVKAPVVVTPVKTPVKTPTAAPVQKVVAGVAVSANKGKAPVPAPAVKAPKAPKVRVETPRSIIVPLLLKRNMTDEEILAKVVERFGTGLYTTNKAYIQLTRSDMNAGLIKQVIVDGSMTAHIGKVIINEKGERVELPYKPSNLRKAELVFKVD